MRIAIDVTPIQPDGECGGATQLIFELLRGFLKKNVQQSFVLLTSHANDALFKKFDSPKMQRICVLNRVASKNFLRADFLFEKVKKLFSFPSGQGILKKNNISVLFCPMSAPTYFEPGIPVVSTIHDLQHFYYPSFFSSQELSHRSSFYFELIKRADFIICVSSFTKKTVMERLKVPSEKIFVIPNCVHSRFVDSSQYDADKILNKFNLLKKTYCIYPANFWPHKNHTMLLTAFGMFTKQHPQSDLHLVLPGAQLHYSKTIENAVKQMRLENNVHILGYLNDNELSNVWKRSHFLIYPSLFEGFGIPLAEAMKYGKPIAASSVTSIPEVAGNAAVYFNPGKPDEIVQSIYAIMTNEKMYTTLVEKGREQLQRYNFDVMVDKYISVLKKALEAVNVRVSGIYEDGWTSDFVQIALNNFPDQKIVLLHGYIPDHHPARSLTIRIKSSSGKSKKYTFDKTEEICLQEEISGEPCSLTIQISDGFIPKQTTADSEDPRTLTFILRELFILDKKSGEKLYEFKYPT